METARRAGGRPQGRPLHWIRWQHKPLMEERGMTPEQAEARARRLAEQFIPEYGRRKVYQNGLDNPYMSDEARQVILNDMERTGVSRVSGTRPSQRRAVGTTINYPRTIGA